MEAYTLTQMQVEGLPPSYILEGRIGMDWVKILEVEMSS